MVQSRSGIEKSREQETAWHCAGIRNDEVMKMGIYEDLKGKRVLITGASHGIGKAVAKAFSADLTLMFHNDAARITAQFVGENNISHIVTGMHDGGDRSFLVRFNELAPSVSISMVDKDHNVYTMSARVAARI